MKPPPSLPPPPPHAASVESRSDKLAVRRFDVKPSSMRNPRSFDRYIPSVRDYHVTATC